MGPYTGWAGKDAGYEVPGRASISISYGYKINVHNDYQMMNRKEAQHEHMKEDQFLAKEITSLTKSTVHLTPGKDFKPVNRQGLNACAVALV